MRLVAILVVVEEEELEVEGAKALVEHQERLGHWLLEKAEACLPLVAWI